MTGQSALNDIYEIAAFLRGVLDHAERVNFVDVGCAVGDFGKLLSLDNTFAIGIDPLLTEYRKRKVHSLEIYDRLYEMAVDTKEGDATFRVTGSLDTSSLKEFNRDHIITEEYAGDYGAKKKFFIPAKIVDFVTTVTEVKSVQTVRLDSILRDENLEESIVHLLKIDAQGNDLNVLRSCGELLQNVLFIVVESTFDEAATLYSDSSTFSDDDGFLRAAGFSILAKARLLKDDCDCLYYNPRLLEEGQNLGAPLAKSIRDEIEKIVLR